MGQDSSAPVDDRNVIADGKGTLSLNSDQTDPREQTQQRQKAKLDDIIIVSSKVEDKQEKAKDEDLLQLKNIKFSKPVLSQHLTGNELDYASIPRMSSGPITEMILRYQFHLTECAEAVSFDQNVLTKRIKEVDSLAGSVYNNMNERYKFVENAISQIEISELFVMLEKIETNMINTKLQFQMLNRLLPDEDQIYDPELT